MRPRRESRAVLRHARFETFEERLALSAQPWGDAFPASLSDHGLQHHYGELSPLESVAPVGDFQLETGIAARVDHHYGDLTPSLADAHQTTGVNYVHNTYGFDGAGQTVAVIDSGVAFDHVALGGGFGSGYRVVGGWDFAENDANPYDDGPSGFHGTHVAGIVGSSDAAHRGVASGVDLAALRVFDDQGAGYFSWVEQALDWVHQNRNAFDNPITTVNLSLGTTWNADSVPEWANLEDEFAQLEQDGIFIAVSAGNSFEDYQSPGLSYPAASPFVVPVASVDNDGAFSYFSQRNHRVLAAPGRSITSTVPDHTFGADGNPNDFGTASGTSMASPYVAGASVLVRQAMEFVGLQNITQDVIYDHLRSTADVFYDPATAANYHRIDVQAALDALMPSDDYGSTAATAHALGTLQDNLQVGGLIGTLADVDYFTFTAGATGTASMTVDATHDLAANCGLVGGGGTVENDTLSFDVVAGQSYTVYLQTTDGLGHYDAAFALEAAAIELGTVDYLQLASQDIAGATVYELTAARAGLLTVEGLFAHAAGDVNLQLYDASQQLVGSSQSAGDHERIDVAAAAGQTFRLHVTGANADVDLRLTNLVAINGNQLQVFGTSAADRVVFDAASMSLTINDVHYGGELLAGVDTVTVDTAAGADTVTARGTSGDETATLRVGSVELTGAAFSFYAQNVETGFAHGGGGHDVADLFDSAGADRFVGKAHCSWLTGQGFLSQVDNFDRVVAWASGGSDTAVLYDSIGDDRFVGQAERSWLVGDGFLNQAEGFELVVAVANQGGADTAELHDSQNNDRFIGRAGRSWMRGPGYLTQADNFERVFAYATAGQDSATLYDSAADDRFVGRAERAWVSGGGFLNQVEQFDLVRAFATEGGVDSALLYDSAGDDRFVGRAGRSWMTGAGFVNQAEQFERVIAYATAGGRDTALLYDSLGDDRFVGRADRSWITGSGYLNQAEGFERVLAYSQFGGFDTAMLYDTVGDDLLRSHGNESMLVSGGMYNLASGFRRTQVHADRGGVDRAVFDELGAGDLFFGRNDLASVASQSTDRLAYGFDEVTAAAKSDELPTADVDALDYVFDRLGNWDD